MSAWETLRAELAARGVTARLMWETRRDGKRVTARQPADVKFYVFVGDGFSPNVATAVVLEYGNGNGFGIYVDEGHAKISEAADNIARPRE